MTLLVIVFPVQVKLSKTLLKKNKILFLYFSGDDSSRMSFSSTSSKESSAITSSDRNGSVLHSSLSEPGKEI
jgi:hypothetical protein